MKTRTRNIMRAASLLLLAGVLAGCSNFIPPTQVGDPFELNNTQVTTLNLAHVGADPEAAALQAPQQIAPWFNVAMFPDSAPPGVNADFHTSISGLMTRLLQGDPDLASQLPPQFQFPAPPPQPGLDMAAILQRLLASYVDPNMSTPPTSLPDTGDAINAALLRMIAEQRRQLQQDMLDEVRRAREAKLEEMNARMRELLERSMQQVHDDPEPNLNLPLPFHLPAGALDIDVPDIVRLLVNGFSQDISVAEFQLSVPDEVSPEDVIWPDTLSLESVSVALNAVRSSEGQQARPLLRHSQTLSVEIGEGIVFVHDGDGRYVPQDPDAVHMTLKLNTRDARELFVVINNREAITGSIDLALLVSPALRPDVGLNFTIRAGEAVIQH